MRLQVTIEIDDEDFTREMDLKKFRWSLQDAMNHYWSIARMETVRVVDVVEQKPPSETERIGPLG